MPITRRLFVKFPLLAMSIIQPTLSPRAFSSGNISQFLSRAGLKSGDRSNFRAATILLSFSPFPLYFAVCVVCYTTF